MKFDTNERVDLFSTGQALHPELGVMFQNSIDVTPEMLNEEIDRIRRLQEEEHRRFEAYLWKLGDILCFRKELYS